MKYGCVAITGKPNVGKSTFVNTLLNKKVAIVSPKPQTTRNQIHAIYQEKDLVMEIIDTPGYHEPHFKLDLFLNAQIKNSYKQADVVLFFVDLSRAIDDEDWTICQLLTQYQVKNIILVLTKSDLVGVDKVNKYKDLIESKIKPVAVISVSSKKHLNFDALIKTIKNYLSDTPQPNNITENDNFMISEIIREQTIFNTSQELPYAVGVYVESNQYDKVTNVLTISAVIVVEKESQKPIIIGKGGQMIKKIGTHARKELLKIFACAINLKLFVKVQKEWRNDERFLKQIGYSN